jgi:hypothetical protein
MNMKKIAVPPKASPVSGVSRLLGQLRALIGEARQQSLRAVDAVQVRTCWEVGRHIVEFEQGGKNGRCMGMRSCRESPSH